MSSLYKTFQTLFWKMVCILTIMLQNGYKQHFQWNAISKLLCYGDTNIKAYPRYSRLSCSSRNWMQCSLHCYCADEYLHPHLHSKAIISLKLNALHSKWGSADGLHAQWPRDTSTKEVVAQIWEQISSISALIKLQSRKHVLWLQWLSRSVTDILHRLIGHFSIVLSLYI